MPDRLQKIDPKNIENSPAAIADAVMQRLIPAHNALVDEVRELRARVSDDATRERTTASLSPVSPSEDGDQGDAGEKTEPGAGDDTDEEDLLVSNTAEALAEKHDLDLAGVEGTGQKGKITKPDVEAALAKRLKPVAGVTDLNSALEFLATRDVDVSELRDEDGDLHQAKIEAEARDLGYHFPNYGN